MTEVCNKMLLNPLLAGISQDQAAAITTFLLDAPQCAGSSKSQRRHHCRWGCGTSHSASRRRRRRKRKEGGTSRGRQSCGRTEWRYACHNQWRHQWQQDRKNQERKGRAQPQPQVSSANTVRRMLLLLLLLLMLATSYGLFGIGHCDSARADSGRWMPGPSNDTAGPGSTLIGLPEHRHRPQLEQGLHHRQKYLQFFEL